MTGALTAEIQTAARPDLDFLYAELGQQVTIYAQQEAVDSGGPEQPPPDEYDEDGNPITPLPEDPTPDTPGAGTSLGTFGCIAMQMDANERARAGIGADLPNPIWEVYIHYSAPLATPGVLLVVEGGELPAPLRLRPLADAVDEGTQRVMWVVLGQAQEALRGAP
ncbi:hypothetical protein QR90_06740 [Deinococcus radiopugnans]|uniref:Uncharacterized protein n=1 Tax=Deinococcus radiopugnans TaxID=57497 RepID=A0A0A7KFG8_9DEIO|nr:hypothetical protein [Deinococcus radiopugnans]AIZ44866.1 hypothetical protein QR90_06740 [Deinococcus radiopugnans]